MRCKLEKSAAVVLTWDDNKQTALFVFYSNRFNQKEVVGFFGVCMCIFKTKHFLTTQVNNLEWKICWISMLVQFWEPWSKQTKGTRILTEFQCTLEQMTLMLNVWIRVDLYKWIFKLRNAKKKKKKIQMCDISLQHFCHWSYRDAVKI